ncbi:MAG TPA: glycoside hydrolase family 38 C-terminal domain-containing protein [Actinomycetota bacterium]|jgi:alpha-mannosidase
MAAQRTVHIVPHTHWDREWYEPFQRFRLRLVDLVDRVLALAEADEGFAFTFDGQTAAVEDYLEVRPEAEGRLRRLAERGQLALGPWRILNDEFLVSGETIVRNLESGWRRAQALGGAMPVGYLPDQFGHVAQLPQVLRRAGLASAVLWRGVPAAIDHHAFLWEAPDRSTVRAEYLPAGYVNAVPLLALPEGLAERLATFDELMRPFYGDDDPLGMYGSDHSEPLPELVAVVDRLNAGQDRYRLRIETLADYVASQAGAVDGDRLPRWRGELRSAARANLLMGVVSARVEVKAACTHAERVLERYAEPLQALWGRSWPARFLELAWGKVVESSGHDSVTGCGADAVAAQVLVRLGEAEQLGGALRDRAAAEVARAVPAGAAVVLNPTPAPRSGLVELDLAVPAAWEAVALELPGGRRLPTQESGRGDPVLLAERLPAGLVPAMLWRRMHGRELLGQVVNGHRIQADAPGGPRLTITVGDHPDPPELDVDRLRREVTGAMEAAPERTWWFQVEASPRRRLLADVPVPPLGWTTVRPLPATAAPGGPVVAGGGRLENGLVTVEVAEDGTLRVAAAGRQLSGVGRLVDGGDAGDLYNYAPPPAGDELVDRPSEVALRLLEAGPLRARLEVSRLYRWPDGLAPGDRSRSSRRLPVATTTLVELRAGEPFVRLAVAVENRCRDHRLRLHVPLAEQADRSAAEGQFAVVERGRRAEGGHGEVPLPTFPARGFVAAGGVALLLDQVSEYELLDGELAVTVLRAVGQISRNANPWRVEPAGPQLPTPGAQCLGSRELRLAVMPHAGPWHQAGVLAAMERYQHDLVAAPGSALAQAAAPAEASGLEVTGEGVVLSSLRRRNLYLELRLVCEHPEATVATVTGPFDAARRADLLGRPGEPLPVSGRTLRLPLQPWEIATVQLHPEQRPVP